MKNLKLAFLILALGFLPGQAQDALMFFGLKGNVESMESYFCDEDCSGPFDEDDLYEKVVFDKNGKLQKIDAPELGVNGNVLSVDRKGPEYIFRIFEEPRFLKCYPDGETSISGRKCTNDDKADFIVEVVFSLANSRVEQINLSYLSAVYKWNGDVPISITYTNKHDKSLGGTMEFSIPTEFDTQGNWTKCAITAKTGNKEEQFMLIRKIKYFDADPTASTSGCTVVFSNQSTQLTLEDMMSRVFGLYTAPQGVDKVNISELKSDLTERYGRGVALTNESEMPGVISFRTSGLYYKLVPEYHKLKLKTAVLKLPVPKWNSTVSMLTYKFGLDKNLEKIAEETVSQLIGMGFTVTDPRIPGPGTLYYREMERGTTKAIVAWEYHDFIIQFKFE